MAALDVFLPSVRRHINGPLEIMMRQSLLEAAIAFCRESMFCRQERMLVRPAILSMNTAMNWKVWLPSNVSWRVLSNVGIRMFRVLGLNAAHRMLPRRNLIKSLASVAFSSAITLSLGGARQN